MFVDVAKIMIKSGDGGDGAVSFHREKFVAKGGPDGGDGGRGGNIVFQADAGMHTLMDAQYRRKFEAENGGPGISNRRNGKNGQDVIIKVPVGTVVREEGGKAVADLNKDGLQCMVLRGGRGGWGNTHYATASRRAPTYAQPGQRTRAYEVVLELKSIADIGLVGFPNVGKSTLLSVCTQARPKIANYHFTTLTPNLGVAQADNRYFHMADIPGLIENAHEGAGLGHDFLRHVERTRVLAHVVDISGSEGRDPVDDYEKINAELSSYSARLGTRPQVVVANKMDIPGAEENLEKLREHLSGSGIEIYPISAAANQGVKELLRALADLLDAHPAEEPVLFEPIGELASLVSGDEYEITQESGVFVVRGNIVRTLLDSVSFDDSVSVQYFEKRLEETGIVDELRRMGAKDGDTVRFGDTEFEFWD